MYQFLIGILVGIALTFLFLELESLLKRRRALKASRFEEAVRAEVNRRQFTTVTDPQYSFDPYAEL